MQSLPLPGARPYNDFIASKGRLDFNYSYLVDEITYPPVIYGTFTPMPTGVLPADIFNINITDGPFTGPLQVYTGLINTQIVGMIQFLTNLLTRTDQRLQLHFLN